MVDCITLWHWVTDGYSKQATLQLANRLGVLVALAQACATYRIGIKLEDIALPLAIQM